MIVERELESLEVLDRSQVVDVVLEDMLSTPQRRSHEIADVLPSDVAPVR
jgi:hypothetical protein